MLTRLLLALIRFYQQAVSPALPSACRFQPTCSRYAYTAIERFGPWRGSWLAARRLLRCTPLCPRGYDPVPDKGDPLPRGELRDEGVRGSTVSRETVDLQLAGQGRGS